MKKIILPLAAVMLMFTACKKDFTCSCTHASVSSDGGSSTSTSETTYTDVTRSFVKNKAECYSTVDMYTYPSFDPVTFEEITVTVTNTNTCTLEK